MSSGPPASAIELQSVFLYGAIVSAPDNNKEKMEQLEHNGKMSGWWEHKHITHYALLKDMLTKLLCTHNRLFLLDDRIGSL